MDFDGDQCAVVPEDSEFGKIICNGVRHFSFDIYENGLSAKKCKYSDDGLFNYLADTAKPDRTGIITNHGTRCLDLSNSLEATIIIAKSLNASIIRFVHPKCFGKDEMGFYGSKYTYGTTTEGNHTIMVVRGYVYYERWWSQEKIVGDYTLDQVHQIADYYLGLVEIIRLLQGREIDGAKTGVYAEGLSGKDYVGEVKVPFTPHCMIIRQETLKRDVGNSSIKNEYHSFSPLAFLCDYVTYQTTSVEEGGAGRILPELKNGANMSLQMYCCLTAEERAFFNCAWQFTDGTIKTIIDVMNERKTAYNQAMFNMSKSNLDKDDSSNLLKSIKENERAYLTSLAQALNCPLTVIAVAAYAVTYSRQNNQNTGLTYGWILPATNLEVFSRANKAFRLIRLNETNINWVKVMKGELYVDGKRKMAVDAYDGYAPIRVINGIPCALLHKKTPTTAQPIVTDNNIYTISTTGFAYHIGKLINNTDNNTMVASWKETIKQNKFQFDITEDKTGQIVISINGYSLSALILNNAHVEQMAPLLGKKVTLVNNKFGPVEQQIQWKPGSGTISNLRVVIVGEAN